MKRLPFNRILLILLILVSTLPVLFVYLYGFEDNPPVEFNNLPFPTDKGEYHPGESIILTLDYCRYTNAPYTRNVRFVDGLVFSVPEQRRGGASVGCRVVDVISEIIPTSLPPGTYYLSGKNIYHVNTFADRIVEWTSETFIVLP